MFWKKKDKNEDLKKELADFKELQKYYDIYLIISTILEGTHILVEMNLLTDLKIMHYIKERLDSCKNYVAQNFFSMEGFELNLEKKEDFEIKEIKIIVSFLNLAKGNFTVEVTEEKERLIIKDFKEKTTSLIIKLVDPKSEFNIAKKIKN